MSNCENYTVYNLSIIHSLLLI